MDLGGHGQVHLLCLELFDESLGQFRLACLQDHGHEAMDVRGAGEQGMQGEVVRKLVSQEAGLVQGQCLSNCFQAWKLYSCGLILLEVLPFCKDCLLVTGFTAIADLLRSDATL